MAEIAELLARAPSIAAFGDIIERLMAEYTADAARAERELIPRALDGLAGWPPRCRVLPPFFGHHLLAGRFLGLLRLAKILSLSELTWGSPSADFLRGPARWEKRIAISAHEARRPLPFT